MSSQVQNVVTRVKLRVERARARYGWFDVAITTFKRFSDDDGGSYAAALTYYIFFSIFPLLLFAAALLGYLTFGDDRLRREIFDTGVESFPLIRNVLNEEALNFIEDRRRGLALTGLVLALYSGSGVIVALQHALNRVLHVRQEPNAIQKRLISLKWLALLGVGAIVTVALGGLSNFAAELFGEGSILARIMAVVGFVAGFAVNVGLFAISFRVLPAKSQSWRQVLPGSVVGAIAFELLKLVGATYIAGGSSSRQATFGAFALAAGLLVASYLLSQIVLLAAELNAVLHERKLTRETTPEVNQGGGS